MDADIKTLIANLRHAARDKIGAVIGGGAFTPATLKAAADLLERSEAAPTSDPEKISTAKVDSDPAYRALYMKYLGTLRVLGEAFLFLHRNVVSADVRDQADLCMTDAARFLQERVRIRRVGNRFDLEPVDPEE